jgi:rhamnosyltransferase
MRINQAGIELPRVAVLLAAYNGFPYIKEQLASIFSQVNVSLIVYVSIDKSTDGTEDFLLNLAEREERLKLLPLGYSFGSAGLNFYRLIKEVDFLSYDYIAYSDQDDIWETDKIFRQITLLEISQAEGVSSNVIAFGDALKDKVVKKSQPQKFFDFIFESAGPGCSFLMSPNLVNKVYEQLISETSVARTVLMHDWLTYSICRAHSMKWVIDSIPTLKYRQHQNNVIGANLGLKSILARYNKIKNGWYRGEVRKICKVCLGINGDINLSKLNKILDRKNFLSNVLLMSYVFQGRRKFTDRLLLATMVLLCVF